MQKGISIQDLRAWIDEVPAYSLDRALSWKIDNNPEAVFTLINTLFPGEFRKLKKGQEKSEVIRVEMHGFLTRKAEKHNAAVMSLLSHPTYDPTSSEGWTIINP